MYKSSNQLNFDTHSSEARERKREREISKVVACMFVKGVGAYGSPPVVPISSCPKENKNSVDLGACG